MSDGQMILMSQGLTVNGSVTSVNIFKHLQSIHSNTFKHHRFFQMHSYYASPWCTSAAGAIEAQEFIAPLSRTLDESLCFGVVEWLVLVLWYVVARLVRLEVFYSFLVGDGDGVDDVGDVAAAVVVWHCVGDVIHMIPFQSCNMCIEV